MVHKCSIELAKKLLPIMEGVQQTSDEGKATVYKAVELMETMDPLVQYSYTVEEYDFRLEGRCRRILDQYDSTYKEVIVCRKRTEMDQVETKTGDCSSLLGVYGLFVHVLQKVNVCILECRGIH